MTLGQDDFPNIVELASATAIDSHGGQQTLLVAELDDAVVGYAHVHWVSALFLRGPEGTSPSCLFAGSLADVAAAAPLWRRSRPSHWNGRRHGCS